MKKKKIKKKWNVTNDLYVHPFSIHGKFYDVPHRWIFTLYFRCIGKKKKEKKKVIDHVMRERPYKAR